MSVFPIPDPEIVIAQTRCWVDRFVIGLQLCPFAKREVERGSLHYVVANGVTPAELLDLLRRELMRLEAEPAIETTLLIHPGVLEDFLDFIDFLDECQDLLVSMALDGVYQIASFHPDYQFAGSEPDDAENYSNKSPYPMLHLLRESSVSRAVDTHPNIDGVPERNIALLEGLGVEKLDRMWKACLLTSQEKVG